MRKEEVTPRELNRRVLRSFIFLLAGLALAAGAFLAIRGAETIDGLPWPLRKAFEINAFLGEMFLNPSRTESAPPSIPVGTSARLNGDIGLEAPLDLSSWKLEIISPVGGGPAPNKILVNMETLKSLPRTEVRTNFKCIEGWSEVMTFAGVKFTDFISRFHIGTHSGLEPHWQNRRQDLYAFVGLETPDKEYYVSVDMKSMLNPQTLLAYEQNGIPLTPGHGAPLRLYIPNKYGVKSLKRIGRIIFSDSRLPDFWGEQGYDWFIGL